MGTPFSKSLYTIAKPDRYQQKKESPSTARDTDAAHHHRKGTEVDACYECPAVVVFTVVPGDSYEHTVLTLCFQGVYPTTMLYYAKISLLNLQVVCPQSVGGC